MLDNYLKATETYVLSRLEIGDHLQVNILQEQTESHKINNTISGTYRWLNGKGTLQVQSCESDLKHHAQTMVLTVLLSRPPDSITEHTTPRTWPGVPWMMQFRDCEPSSSSTRTSQPERYLTAVKATTEREREKFTSAHTQK